MITATLYRQPSGNFGTFGVFTIPELQWCCFSLERRWEQNTQFVSCIPVGEYFCSWTESNKFGRYTYQIKNVKKRYGIRFHPANSWSELSGCIALGLFVGYVDGNKRLIDSRKAITKFEKLMNTKDFKLVIK